MIHAFKKVFKKFRHSSSLLPIDGAVFYKNMPYYAQWESKDMIGKILSKKVSPAEDSLWKKSGARTQREYVIWSWNGCGMACLKMVLKHIKDLEVPLVVLGRVCMSYGGYKVSKKGLDGLFYKPFVEFVKKEYGLDAKVESPLLIDDILQALSEKNYVIASVNPEIRNPDAYPKKKGGHLILIVGYDYFKKLLYIHNPSGDNNKNQAFAEISFGNFKKFFAERGIVIQSIL